MKLPWKRFGYTSVNQWLNQPMEGYQGHKALKKNICVSANLTDPVFLCQSCNFTAVQKK